MMRRVREVEVSVSDTDIPMQVMSVLLALFSHAGHIRKVWGSWKGKDLSEFPHDALSREDCAAMLKDARDRGLIYVCSANPIRGFNHWDGEDDYWLGHLTEKGQKIANQTVLEYANHIEAKEPLSDNQSKLASAFMENVRRRDLKKIDPGKVGMLVLDIIKHDGDVFKEEGERK